MSNIFILSYKPTKNDTRVQNQIKGLRDNYRISVIELKAFNKYKRIKFRFNFFNWNTIKTENLSLNNSLFFTLKPFKTILKPFKTILKPFKTILKPFKTIIKPFKTILKTLIKIIFFLPKIILRFIKNIIRNNQSYKLIINFLLVNNLLISKIKKLKSIPDVILANDLMTLPTAIYFKFITNCKIIYDMHEYELDRVPRSSFFKKSTIYFLEEITIPFADYITTVSYSIKYYYKKRFKKKIYLILNSPEKNKKINNNEINKKLNLQKGFICIGNISHGRNIEDLIILANKNKFYLTFMGNVSEQFNIDIKFFEKIKESSFLNYLNPVQPNEIIDVLINYESSLFLYDISYKNYDYALPNKFLLAIMCQKPVISFESTELKLFQKRHKVKLNLLKNLNELNNKKITNNISLKETELNFYSKERQIKILKKLINNLIKNY